VTAVQNCKAEADGLGRLGRAAVDENLQRDRPAVTDHRGRKAFAQPRQVRTDLDQVVPLGWVKITGCIAASNPRIPFIATILPKAAMATADVRKAFDEFDRHYIFGHLIAELALYLTRSGAPWATDSGAPFMS
jgi:hypothetical protein